MSLLPYATISFEDTRGVSPYSYSNMIKLGEGYYDFYSRSKLERAKYYVPVGWYYYDQNGVLTLATKNSATHRYDASEGIIRVRDGAEVATHCEGTRDFYIQQPGYLFPTSFEVNNLSFNKEEWTDDMITAFVKAAVSLAGFEFRFVSDSNYTMPDTPKRWSMGDPAETGSFSNETVLYCGNRRFVIKRIETQQKISDCVRFKITAKMDAIDEWRIYSVELNNSGLIFSGGEVDG